MSIISKLMYRFHIIPIKIPADLLENFASQFWQVFFKIDKQKSQDTPPKEKSGEGPALAAIETYHKTIEIKKVWVLT